MSWRRSRSSWASPRWQPNLDRMTRVLHRQEQLLERWDAAGGPSVEGRARATLLELGLEEEELELPTRALSGGQRKLIALAACLEQRPDVLLLDEPEAHLDNVGRARVERLASRFDGAIVAVSHDRYLLDEIVTTIASLDAGRIRLWPGNYSAYTVARELELERQRQQYVTQQKEIERLEAAIKRFELWASWVPDERHIRQARNKQRQIDRMDKVERPVLERRRIALQLRPTTRGGQRVFELRSLGVAFGSEPVLAGIDLTVMHGERVGVVGDNGAGKSVLLKMLVGEIEPTEGEVWVGPSIEIGYLAQDQDTLDPASTSPRHRAARRARFGGGRRRPADEVPLPVRAGTACEQAALGRRAHAATAPAADGRPPESARARRADEPSRHRVGGGAGESPRGVRRHRRRHLPRPLLPRPHRGSHRRSTGWGRTGKRRRLFGLAREEGDTGLSQPSLSSRV